jgi:hypothetical protein
MLHKRRLSQIIALKNHQPGYGTIAPSPSSVVLVDLSDDGIDTSQDRV